MKCSTKNCRDEMAIIYLNEPLCQQCWKKLCDKQLKLWEEENGCKQKNSNNAGS